jgi:hypothetical protein
LADWQVVPLEARRAYADTDLAPVAAPLTVKVPLPVPEAVPVVPSHVKVDPAVPDARNTTFVF